MTPLGALRPRSIGRGPEMERLTAIHDPARPGPPVETDRDFPDFLDHDFQTPGTELVRHPALGVLEGMRTDRTSADPVRDEILDLHGLVVGGPEFDQLPDRLVLGRDGKGESEGGKQDQILEGFLHVISLYILVFK